LKKGLTIRVSVVQFHPWPFAAVDLVKELSTAIRLRQEFIKFRRIPPSSPDLNGKVERSKLTDLVEFWTRHTPEETDIEQRIEESQFNFNWRRSHGGHGGGTPRDRIGAIGERVPLREEVEGAYDEGRERTRYRDWKVDQVVAALRTPSA
jgi:hypothetical protein